LFILAPQKRKETPVFSLADAHVLKDLECILQLLALLLDEPASSQPGADLVYV
jgi:hypothetical protein